MALTKEADVVPESMLKVEGEMCKESMIPKINLSLKLCLLYIFSPSSTVFNMTLTLAIPFLASLTFYSHQEQRSAKKRSFNFNNKTLKQLNVSMSNVQPN